MQRQHFSRFGAIGVLATVIMAVMTPTARGQSPVRQSSYVRSPSQVRAMYEQNAVRRVAMMQPSAASQGGQGGQAPPAPATRQPGQLENDPSGGGETHYAPEDLQYMPEPMPDATMVAPDVGGHYYETPGCQTCGVPAHCEPGCCVCCGAPCAYGMCALCRILRAPVVVARGAVRGAAHVVKGTVGFVGKTLACGFCGTCGPACGCGHCSGCCVDCCTSRCSGDHGAPAVRGCGDVWLGDGFSPPYPKPDPCDQHGNWVGGHGVGYHPGQRYLGAGSGTVPTEMVGRSVGASYGAPASDCQDCQPTTVYGDTSVSSASSQPRFPKLRRMLGLDPPASVLPMRNPAPVAYDAAPRSYAQSPASYVMTPQGRMAITPSDKDPVIRVEQGHPSQAVVARPQAARPQSVQASPSRTPVDQGVVRTGWEASTQRLPAARAMQPAPSSVGRRY